MKRTKYIFYSILVSLLLFTVSPVKTAFSTEIESMSTDQLGFLSIEKSVPQTWNISLFDQPFTGNQKGKETAIKNFPVAVGISSDKSIPGTNGFAIHVPEPATIFLFGCGLAFIGTMGRKAIKNK